jgi:hypothetical protein
LSIGLPLRVLSAALAVTWIFNGIQQGRVFKSYSYFAIGSRLFKRPDVSFYKRAVRPVFLLQESGHFGRHAGERDCVIMSEIVLFLSVMPDPIRHPAVFLSEKQLDPGSSPG